MNSSDLQNNNRHISSYKEGFSPDVEAGLSRLKGRIGSAAEPQPAKVRRLSRRRLLSVAAAVLLLISAGFVVLFGDGATSFENNTTAPMAVSLPDGTEVLLQQGAELSYGADYNETDRLIDLEGQAYFRVAKNTERPFLVNTSETELRVTGTAFNLRVKGEEMEVDVSEGSVELHRGGDVVAVKAKQCGLVLPGERPVVMTTKNLNRHAWRTGILRFESVLLTEVLEVISNNYGFTVSVTDGCDFPFSGVFSNDDPVAVLETVALSGQGELKIIDEDSKIFSVLLPNCE